MKKILYTHPDESVAYLIDRMENTEESSLYIIADQNPAFFTDAVNIKLLRREAATLGKNIIVVSLNPAVIGAAKNASMDTLEMSAVELEADEGQAVVPAVSLQEMPVGAIDAEEKVNVRVVRDEERPSFFTQKERNKDTDKETRVTLGPRNTPLDEEIEPHQGGIAFSWKIIIFSFAGAGVAAGIGFWALAPRLSISLVPKKETVSFHFQVTADSKLSVIDTRADIIPGQIIKAEKEITEEFMASGKQDKQTKAEGKLTIYNVFGANVQPLVKGTRFSAKDGKIFRLKNGITVPGAVLKDGAVASPGSVDAEVVADQAGTEYNIGPSDFSIPGFTGTPKFETFYAKSSVAFAGGGTEGSFTANADDINKARKTLAEKLNTEMQTYASANIPQGLIILDGARSRNEPEFSADMPGKDGKFKATLKGNYEIFAFTESDAVALVENKFAEKLARAQKTIPGTRVISYASEVLHSGKSILSFTIKVNELVVGFIDEAHLQAQLAGKGEDEIKRILKENEAIESAEVVFWPFWISLAPDNIKRITITTQG